jgi:2-polyprenyl-3-methyl-5-hydroxy-6-metoxy-1,4-benzoquinol methylase
MTAQTINQDQAQAMADRVFGAGIEALDILNIYIGDRLGLYTALQARPSLTPLELAEHAGIHQRYAREWLEQQAVTGILLVDDVAAAEGLRQYSLPAAHAAALTDPESPFSVAPLARALVSVAQTLPKVLDAFRSGGGVPWGDYGADGIEGQGDFNRPWIMRSLATEYLPAIPDVHLRLTTGARVAELACGVGWPCIAIAKAYPNVTADGFDFDGPSIELARGFALQHGVQGRVTFHQRDTADPSLKGEYDLVLIVEALHDLAQPVETLQTVHRLLRPGGVAIVADERTADQFTAPGDAVERFLYGVSTLLCLPAGMADQPSAATGTVIRPDTVRRYAREAGFPGAEEITAIEHPLLRFYRLQG